VFSRNLLPFGIVTAIASLPTVLLFNGHEDVVRINPAAAGALALSGGLSALIYHDLRVAKEGVDTDQIAAVFD
jgi:hypothetical protein